MIRNPDPIPTPIPTPTTRLLCSSCSSSVLGGYLCYDGPRKLRQSAEQEGPMPTRRDTRILVLMACYFFLAMACVSTVKPLQFAFFLKNVGFDWRLPSLYALLALASGPVVLLYRRLTKRYSHARLAGGSLFVFLITLALLYAPLTRDTPGAAALFYVWAGIFSLLAPGLGWIICYDLFTAREGKRYFGLLATGGILGGAAGAFYTLLTARLLGSRTLLAQVWLACWLLLGIVLVILSSRRPAGALADAHAVAPKRADRLAFRLLRSRQAAMLAAVALVCAFATTLIDLNYLWFLKARFAASKEEVARFAAAMLGTTFLASALIQLFLTNRVLARVGARGALLIPPLSLTAAAVPAAAWNRFWPSVVLKGLDGAFRPSLHRTVIELMYVPLPAHQAVTARTIVEMVVFRSGDALGALFFLAALHNALQPTRITGVAAALATALWLLAARALGRQYATTLRASLETRDRSERWRADAACKGDSQVLAGALHSPNPDKLRLALQTLSLLEDQEAAQPEIVPTQMEDLFHTRMSDVLSPRPPLMSRVDELVRHPDARVSAAALHVLVRRKPRSHLKELRGRLRSDWLPADPYLVYLDEYVENPGTFLQPSQVLRWCQNLPPDRAALLARIMGKSRELSFVPVLRQWLNSSHTVLREAAVEGIGCHADSKWFATLVELLSDNAMRRSARRALVYLGPSAVDDLLAVCRDPSRGLPVRREIPLVLGMIRTSTARAALVSILYFPEVELSYRALKALNRARGSLDLSQTEDSFQPLLRLWIRQCYEFANLEAAASTSNRASWRLLRKLAAERRAVTVEKIFRTLELFWPRGDAYSSYLACRSNRKVQRDNAIEFIETRLRGELKQSLIPLITEEDPLVLADLARRRVSAPAEPADVLRQNLATPDPLLKICVQAALASVTEE
jgi:AAA family ATP:ADP antiporter